MHVSTQEQPYVEYASSYLLQYRSNCGLFPQIVLGVDVYLVMAQYSLHPMSYFCQVAFLFPWITILFHEALCQGVSCPSLVLVHKFTIYLTIILPINRLLWCSLRDGCQQQESIKLLSEDGVHSAWFWGKPLKWDTPQGCSHTRESTLVDMWPLFKLLCIHLEIKRY